MKNFIVEFKYVSGNPLRIDSDTIYGSIIDMMNKLGYEVTDFLEKILVSEPFYYDGRNVFLKVSGFFKRFLIERNIKLLDIESAIELLKGNEASVKPLKNIRSMLFSLKTDYKEVINSLKYVKRIGNARFCFVKVHEEHENIENFLKTLSEENIVASVLIPKDDEVKMLECYEIKRKIRKKGKNVIEIFIIDSYSKVRKKISGRIIHLKDYDSIIYGKAFFNTLIV